MDKNFNLFSVVFEVIDNRVYSDFREKNDNFQEAYNLDPYGLNELWKVFSSKQQIVQLPTNNNYTFVIREVNENDYKYAKNSINDVCGIIEKIIIPDLFGDKFEIVDIRVINIGFACVRSKIVITLSSLTLHDYAAIAAILTLIVSVWPDDFSPSYAQSFDKIEIQCSEFISDEKLIANHIGSIIRGLSNRPINSQKVNYFIDPNNKSCVLLRQKALKILGYYTGPIDGKFGNLSYNAELQFAKNNNIDSNNYGALYDEISKKLSGQYQPIKKAFKRKTKRRK